MSETAESLKQTMEILANDNLRLIEQLAAARKVADHLFYLGIAGPEPTRHIAVRAGDIILVLAHRGFSRIPPDAVQEIVDDIDAYVRSSVPPAIREPAERTLPLPPART